MTNNCNFFLNTINKLAFITSVNILNIFNNKPPILTELTNTLIYKKKKKKKKKKKATRNKYKTHCNKRPKMTAKDN